jgi:hypothetical protein
MNPSSTAPSALRRQAVMEELRLLEQHQQAQQQLAAQQSLSRNNRAFQMNGNGVQNLMHGQAKSNVSNMAGGRGGSMDFSIAGGIHDPFLGVNDLSQLQAAMLLHEQQQSPRLNTSRASFSNRGTSSGNGFDLSSHQQLLNATGQFPGRMQEPLLKLPAALDVVKSVRKRPLDLNWGFGAGKYSGMGSTGQNNPGNFESIKIGHVLVAGCSFPLPPLGGKHKKRKLTNRQFLVSFKRLWAIAGTSSTAIQREIFARRLSQGNVQILDRSGVRNRALRR